MTQKALFPSAPVDSVDAESQDLDETVDMPVLFLPGNLKNCNDDDAGPPPRAEHSQSTNLIEVGESINKNLERIAAALENMQAERRSPAKGRTATAKPESTAKKPAAGRKTAGKKAARKTKRT